MKIAEFIQKAQYSRLSVGDRWLTASSLGWQVCERRRYQKTTRIIIDTESEDEAVAELIKGEELYDDL